MSQQAWQNYEEVAQYILNQLAEYFGIGRVEGKQIVSGISGAEWEIDAKGYKEDGFVVIECKHHRKQGLAQGVIADLAFRIQDTGAAGGFIVSPLPLQSGARKVAQNQGIAEITLNADSTTADYILKFLEQTFHGASCQSNVVIGDRADATVIRASERGEIEP